MRLHSQTYQYIYIYIRRRVSVGGPILAALPSFPKMQMMHDCYTTRNEACDVHWKLRYALHTKQEVWNCRSYNRHHGLVSSSFSRVAITRCWRIVCTSSIGAIGKRKLRDYRDRMLGVALTRFTSATHLLSICLISIFTLMAEIFEYIYSFHGCYMNLGSIKPCNALVGSLNSKMYLSIIKS